MCVVQKASLSVLAAGTNLKESVAICTVTGSFKKRITVGFQSQPAIPSY